MQVNYLSLNSNQFTSSALLGTSGKASLMQSISDRCGGGSYFGGAADPFREGYQVFMKEAVAPIRAAQQAAFSVNESVERPDVIRPITSIQDVRSGIPPSMYIPILCHPTIRKQLEEGIIDGFGITPDQLPDDDVYPRLVNNGTIVVNDNLDNKNPELVWEFHSDDPELNEDELEAIRDTYDFCDDWVSDDETSIYDITDYPSLHG